MPIHTLKFGNKLSWVFLGGEVVVDYQLQIEKELNTESTWVAAYTDDVFAYVASEEMRDQGGYEVDYSMVFYLQPGRWQAGTQSLILRRVREIFDAPESLRSGLNPDDGLAAIQVPSDFKVDLVASEPLVQDPINISFSPDGTVWIVEMSDYPLGNPGGGRIKRLQDFDNDGKLDSATVFLSKLDYPTSVHPWEDGVLVIAAPHVFFARDTNGDGKADQTYPMLSGIHPANPQHRASGFEIGLDGKLHLGVGHGSKTLYSHVNKTSYQVHGSDIALNPATGEIFVQGGETQFVPARDEFGNWFGNSNSKPMYQFVFSNEMNHAGDQIVSAESHVLSPPVAPPVFPRGRNEERFNDHFALNRFTSACSSMPIRSLGFGPEFDSQALICEPVHNLVARYNLQPDGTTFRGSRLPAEQNFDFFTSTDTWSRPVRAINAPDGTVWIVDMMRQVI